jgi:hypothetical protein
VIQVHDQHSVVTTNRTRPEEAMIGVLQTNGAFEVINAIRSPVSTSGCIPRSRNTLPAGWNGPRKRMAAKVKNHHD